MFPTLQGDFLAASTVVGIMIFLSILSKMSSSLKKASQTSSEITKCAQELVAQSNEWQRLSKQDESVLYSLRHASLAVAYMNAARLLCTDETLQRTTGMNTYEVSRSLDAFLRKQTIAAEKEKSTIQNVSEKKMKPRKLPSAHWL